MIGKRRRGDENLRKKERNLTLVLRSLHGENLLGKTAKVTAKANPGGKTENSATRKKRRKLGEKRRVYRLVPEVTRRKALGGNAKAKAKATPKTKSNPNLTTEVTEKAGDLQRRVKRRHLRKRASSGTERNWVS